MATLALPVGSYRTGTMITALMLFFFISNSTAQTVILGDLEFMTTNVSTTTCADGTPIAPANYKKTGDNYGYNYVAIESCNICPEGWRILTKEDLLGLKTLGKTADELISALKLDRQGLPPSGYLRIPKVKLETDDIKKGILSGRIAETSAGGLDNFHPVRCVRSTKPAGPKEVDQNGLTVDINKVLPAPVLNQMKRLNMPINGGSNPPNIEGVYEINPCVLESSNLQYDFKGQRFSDAVMSLTGQNNDQLTLDYHLDEGNENTSDGKTGFIVGEGNKFSIFGEVESNYRGYKAKLIEVVSGELVSGGIENLYMANFMVDNYGNPGGIYIPNEKGRVIYDQDRFSPRKVDAKMLAHWTFDGESGGSDLINLFGDVELKGDAKIEDGMLKLGKGGWAKASGYHGEPFTEKTLVAWAKIDNLSERGGSIMSLEKAAERQFDAIVFGEQEPGKWMAGSDYFRRTNKPSPGYQETKTGEMVMMAITYQTEGDMTRVKIYRNGEKIGDYAKGPVLHFGHGFDLLFGARHTSGGRPVGSVIAAIDDARLYDKALSEAEVKALAGK